MTAVRFLAALALALLLAAPEFALGVVARSDDDCHLSFEMEREALNPTTPTITETRQMFNRNYSIAFVVIAFYGSNMDAVTRVSFGNRWACFDVEWSYTSDDYYVRVAAPSGHLVGERVEVNLLSEDGIAETTVTLLYGTSDGDPAEGVPFFQTLTALPAGPRGRSLFGTPTTTRFRPEAPPESAEPDLDGGPPAVQTARALPERPGGLRPFSTPTTTLLRPRPELEDVEPEPTPERPRPQIPLPLRPLRERD